MSILIVLCDSFAWLYVIMLCDSVAVCDCVWYCYGSVNVV